MSVLLSVICSQGSWLDIQMLKSEPGVKPETDRKALFKTCSVRSNRQNTTLRLLMGNAREIMRLEVLSRVQVWKPKVSVHDVTLQGCRRKLI